MKAVVCEQFGPPELLVLREVDDPVCGHDQVLIDVVAAGVNFPDALIIQNKYQFNAEPPFSPGGEVAGVVAEVGRNVTTVRLGDRVVAVCVYGGFAERAVVNATAVCPIPNGMSLRDAASFLMTYGTMYYALHDRALVRSGESLLVLGAGGGIGSAAVALGRAAGMTVIAAASSERKRQLALRAEAQHVLDYTAPNFRAVLKDLTGGLGVDVIVDPVGGAHAEPAFRSIAWNGRYLVVGFASGEIPRLPLNLPLLKGAAVLGVFWGDFVRREPARNREYLDALWELIATDRVQLEPPTLFPMQRCGEAIRALADRSLAGKAVIEVRPD